MWSLAPDIDIDIKIMILMEVSNERKMKVNVKRARLAKGVFSVRSAVFFDMMLRYPGTMVFFSHPFFFPSLVYRQLGG